MKSIILFLFVIGIVMMALGYQKKMIKNETIKTIVEYRYIPRSIYDEQLSQPNIEKNFADMFKNEDVFFYGLPTNNNINNDD